MASVFFKKGRSHPSLAVVLLGSVIVLPLLFAACGSGSATPSSAGSHLHEIWLRLSQLFQGSSDTENTRIHKS